MNNDELPLKLILENANALSIVAAKVMRTVKSYVQAIRCKLEEWTLKKDCFVIEDKAFTLR